MIISNIKKHIVLPLADCGERLAAQHIEFPLRVALLNKRFVSWYRERFINTFLFMQSFQYVGFDFRFLGYDQDIFAYLRMNLDKEQKETITDYLVKRIGENYYAYINADVYYLPDSPWHLKAHYSHDLMIYGYDIDTQVFYALYFDNSGHMVSKKVPFRSIIDAVYNAPPKNDWEDDDFDLTVFKLKKFDRVYNFRLERFLSELYDYIHSVNKTEEMLFTHYLRTYSKYEYVFGIDGVRNMLEQYRNTGVFHLNMVHFQYEHKMGLMKSLCYVMDHFDLPPYLKTTIQKFNRIVDKYKQLRMLCLKSDMQKEKDKKGTIFDRMGKLLEEAINEEYFALVSIYEQLYTYNIFLLREKFHNDIIFQAKRDMYEPLSISCPVLNTKWLEQQFSYHYSRRYKWEKIKKIVAVQLETSACAVVHFSSGHTFYYNREIKPKTNFHEITFVEPLKVEWVQVDIHSHLPIAENSIPFRVYEVDLAYQKPCTASGYWIGDEDCSPGNAVNNIPDTHWNASEMSKDGEYIEVDLEVPTRANAVIWKQRKGGNRITAYQCYCRTQSGWITIADYDGALFGTKEQKHMFETQEILGVRLKILSTLPDEDGYSEPGVEKLAVYLLHSRRRSDEKYE